ncbi:MAG: MopE-related protein [Myxococcota bacterium]|nr:MopE-related protein [Myxococcota bacterium]MDW8362311.1 lectin-like protein [Myxococcales bacterium]
MSRAAPRPHAALHLALLVAPLGCFVERGGLGAPRDPEGRCPPGWHDANDDPSDTCEYPCVPSSPATERCDGVDNDCDPDTPDGLEDAELGAACDGADEDHCREGRFACVGARLVCDDTTDTSVEHCDGEDDDCDGEVDEEAVDARPFYVDGDFDRHGSPEQLARACRAGPGLVERGDDCDDADRDRHPGALETCNGVDDDCDGEVDEGHVSCDCIRQSLRGRTFHFCRASRPWSAAHDECARAGLHLASIHSHDENAWLTAKARDLLPTSWWIGLNDREHEGRWRWSDGTTVTFTSWLEREPNDGGIPFFTSEDCVELHATGGWNDYPCERDRPYICASPP